jgi:hypothetical protein
MDPSTASLILSLTPSFSWVKLRRTTDEPFQRFLLQERKPLKRFSLRSLACTQRKLGVNEKRESGWLL